MHLNQYPETAYIDVSGISWYIVKRNNKIVHKQGSKFCGSDQYHRKYLEFAKAFTPRSIKGKERMADIANSILFLNSIKCRTVQ